MVLVSSDLWLGFSFLVMARASRPSLEALFADSYGSTARSAKSGWAFARAKSHRRPRRCSADIRHSTPPHSRKILETSLETLFPAAAPAGFTAKIAQGARAAKVCAKRSRSHDRGRSPAALNSRSSAPLSSKRKLEATTALTSTINRKRPLLDNFFGSDASSCQELGSGDKIAKPEAKHPRNKSTSATVACGTAVNAQPVVQISGLQVMLGETRQEPETALRKLVGLARESEAEHRQTHPKPRFDCPRCRFIVFGNAWKQGPAALTHAAHGKRERVAWLAERPPEYGGDWALGCALCAALQYRLWKECGARGRRAKRRISTKFARFEVRSVKCMQACCFHQHAGSDCHIKAVDAFLRPGKPLVEILTPPPGTDEQLLLGSVPQIPAWLRVWRSSATLVSFQGASANLSTEHYIDPAFPEVERRSVKNMFAIMSEVSRRRKRLWLSKAQSITITLDDRNEYKLLRFKCDYEAEWRGRKGVLATLRRDGKAGMSQIEDFDDVYAQRQVDAIRGAVRQFCTTIDGAFDDDLFRHMCAHVRALGSDGAPSAVKTLHWLQRQLFTNAILCIRDPAHAVRIAIREPLLADAAFTKFWQSVFDGEHALIKDIQNSDKLRSMLEACERRVLQVKGVQGGRVDRVLRHFNWAKQRFESFAGPQRRFCCLLIAVCMLLAAIAGDAREKRPRRERAEEALESMTPEFLVTAGLTADYTAECIDFLRIFDVEDHDPGRTRAQKVAFHQRMTKLFLKGWVLVPTPAEAPEGASTLTGVVLSQVEDEPVFLYGNKTKRLWYRGAKAEVSKVMERMHVVVDTMLERVDAELHDSDLLLSFSAFDFGEEYPEERRIRWIRMLGRALRLPRDTLVAEFLRVLPPSRQDYATRKETDKQRPDGREIMARWLDPVQVGQCFPGVEFTALPLCIRFYVAVEDGTSNVERSLGRLEDVLEKHCGPLEDSGATAAHCLELNVDGPRTESEIAVRLDPRGPLVLTDFGRECAQLWVQQHGRRFSCYQKRKEVNKRKGVQAGSDKAVVDGRRAAADALVQLAGGASTGAELTIGACPRNRVCQRPGHGRFSGSRFWNKTFGKFHDLTKKKNAAKLTTALHRRAGVNPFQLGQAQLGGIGAAPLATRGVGLREEGKKLQVFLAGEGSDLREDAAARRECDFVDAARRAELIVVDAPADMEIRQDATWLRTLAIVVAFGKPVLSRDKWQLPRPDCSPHIVRHQAALRTARRLVCSHEFKTKNPKMFQVFQQCAAAEGSKWTVVVEGPEDVAAEVAKTRQKKRQKSINVFLGCRGDACAFLHKVRRLQQPRALGGTYAKPS